MTNVFISYSSADRQYAEAMAGLLHKRGLTVWWDAELMPAERFRERILEEIELSDVVVVLWSENSRKSPWVPDEAKLALDRQKLIQVSLDGEPQPTGFGQATINCCDLSNWRVDDYKTFDIAIFEAIESFIPRKETLEVIKNRLTVELEDSRLALEKTRRSMKWLSAGFLALTLAAGSVAYRSINQLSLYNQQHADVSEDISSLAANVENIGLRLELQSKEISERFRFLNSSDYKVLWGKKSGGPHTQQFEGVVPASATAVILNVIVDAGSNKSGSFVCAGPDGQFDNENWHYKNISVTEYGSDESGGTVICPVSGDGSIKWGMYDNSSKQKTTENVSSYGTLVGWL